MVPVTQSALLRLIIAQLMHVHGDSAGNKRCCPKIDRQSDRPVADQKCPASKERDRLTASAFEELE